MRGSVATGERTLALALATGLLSIALPAAAQIGPPPPPGWLLQQNDPDPFCPGETVVGFAAPQAAQVQLLVFNPDSTAVVRTLVNGQLPAGYHTVLWDGHDEASASLPNGRYPYVLVASDIATQALVFTASKAATIDCPTAVEPQTWSGVRALFR